MNDDHPRRGSGEGTTRHDQPPLLVLKLLDLCLYGLTMAVVIICAATVVSFALGAGWGGSKYLLFVIGFLLFGIGSFGMRPKGAWKDDDDDDDGESRRVSSDDETRLQAFVQAIPPLRWYELDPDDRLSLAAKLFVGSLFVLGTSFVMETAFGVRI
ncbi:DUF7555 family protein [Halococcus saccharolyticus]|uniref:Uncharacterized protein n=1 Tax=Halococcus saccharolyticus DSM 5350 TaxID=1227455 RepID=M0MAF6_9EURY|nr:hypothetical protein [Halococcus saccharolyticus]EMA42731.1 hypothetical protein C449_16353 [Halococcus saccharolyticus DSM 5350]